MKLPLDVRYAIEDKIHSLETALVGLEVLVKRREDEILELTKEVDPAAGFNHLRRIYMDHLHDGSERIKGELEEEIKYLKDRYEIR